MSRDEDKRVVTEVRGEGSRSLRFTAEPEFPPTAMKRGEGQHLPSAGTSVEPPNR